jgi:uncharacterized membrane protein
VHVLGVVIWIGGVTMVTTVVLPAIRRGDVGGDRAAAFGAIEHRFAWQARLAVIVVGLTGFYMMVRLGVWQWFASAQFWWMHAMVGIWLVFAFILFVAEPLILDRRLRHWLSVRPEATLAWLYRAHLALLTVSWITILGAVSGSQGWSLF